MFMVLFSSRSRNLFVRGLHFAKQGTRPCHEDIIVKAVCVNVWRKKWKFLDQMRSSMTNSMISRVFQVVKVSPLILLEFYRRVGGQEAILDSLESCCIVIHVMICQRMYDEADCLLKQLMLSRGHLPLDVLEALIKSVDVWCPPSNVFDILLRCCVQIGATEGAYEVIKKLRVENYWISVHAWNNYLNHLLKMADGSRFWMVYKEMVSYGYCENVDTFNLLIYALSKECNLAEASSVFCRMLKMGIVPNDVEFNVLIGGDCRLNEIDIAVNFDKKMVATPRGYSLPTATAYAPLIDRYSRNGYSEEAFSRSDIAERRLIPYG